MNAAPTGRELAELERAVEVLRQADAAQSPSPYIPHTPHPKQAEFLALDCLEALYGGAAGGGKSDALLMAALQYVHVPGYSALLLRRTFRDLNQPDAIMARSHEWLRGTPAKWHERDKRWTFPSGATLTFGYCDSEKDKFQYAGAALQFIGWDELTQFPAAWYVWLFSRLRKLADQRFADVPLRVRAGTNPGGIGHAWVQRRFVDDATRDRRIFVPALLEDNPSLDATAYRMSLAELDATTRLQLEKGVWVRDAEGLVYHYDEGRNAVDRAPECNHKILALDFGATAPTSFTVLGWRDNDPTVYILGSWKIPSLAPSDAAARIIELERALKFDAIIGDTGGLGKGYQLEFQRRYHAPLEPADKNNKLGYIALFNGDLEKGLIKVVRAACEPLTTEWEELPWHESRLREMGGFDNHCADGALYGWRRCVAFVERAKAVPPNAKERLDAEETAMEEQLEEEARRQRDEDWLAAL